MHLHREKEIIKIPFIIIFFFTTINGFCQIFQTEKFNIPDNNVLKNFQFNRLYHLDSKTSYFNNKYQIKFLRNSVSEEKNDMLKINSLIINGSYNISWWKTSVIAGMTIGAGWWLHNYQQNAWWSEQRTYFHIQNDWGYSMSADKIGHFFDGAFIQTLYSGAFSWAGFKPKTAMWLGTLFSLAYMTDIEIEDGFAKQWGFSPGDELANTLGAFYPVAQHYIEPLKEFNVKWSYCPSDELRSGAKNGAFIDDYNGQTFWLSIGIHKFLPNKWKDYWPDFLNLVTGYGVKNYTDYAHGRQQYFYLGFDLDYTRLIPGNSKFMIWVKNVLNHFRILPLPVIRFGPEPARYVVNY